MFADSGINTVFFPRATTNDIGHMRFLFGVSRSIRISCFFFVVFACLLLFLAFASGDPSRPFLGGYDPFGVGLWVTGRVVLASLGACVCIGSLKRNHGVIK